MKIGSNQGEYIMRRFLSSKSVYVGQLVVVDDSVGAVVRTVAEVVPEESRVVLQWMAGNRFCSADCEAYMLKKPTLEQIEYSIAHYGQLLSSKMLVEVVQ
jgi:hypothetical protein